MKQVLLRAPGFLGDEIVFTGVVRELKRETGWRLRISTGRQDLWRHHRSIEGFEATGDEDIVLQDDLCPPYRAANQTPLHFLEKYLGDVRAALGLGGVYNISRFGGDVQPSAEEMSAPPFDLPPGYWMVVAGWKTGVPAKAWPTANYQRVVDTLRGRIHFVQAGAKTLWHPPLRGVRNLVGLTSLRELISLMYHAEGVICPITSIMHLAAAVPASKASGFALRPCVVVAGGREPPHYITYPMHRVLSMVGQLECCSSGGCGKSNFDPGQCPHPVSLGGGDVPKCMTLIKPADVVQAVEFFYRGMVALPRRLGSVEALLQRVSQCGYQRGHIYGAEIGACRGEISAQLLRAFHEMYLTMVDEWGRKIGDPAPSSATSSNPVRLQSAAVETTRFAASRRLLIPSSAQALSETRDGSLDFAFFNAERRGHLLATDLQKWCRKVRLGGILGGDRYFVSTFGRAGVKGIVDAYACKNRCEVEKDKGDSWFIRVS